LKNIGRYDDMQRVRGKNSYFLATRMEARCVTEAAAIARRPRAAPRNERLRSGRLEP
jgi:hypothetical protein